MRTLKKEEGESLVILSPMDTEVMKKGFFFCCFFFLFCVFCFFFSSKSVSNFLQLAAVR